MTTFGAEDLDGIKKEVLGIIADIEAGKFEAGDSSVLLRNTSNFGIQSSRNENCYNCDYKNVCGREE